MKSKKYKCLYCHSEFTIKRQIKEQKDGSFTYELREINFCPFCGMPYKHTIDTTKDFMNLFPVTNELNNSVKLLMKGEPDAAIRDASVVLENIIKKKSGIQDKHGKALIGEAFNTGKDIELEPPKIKINDLKTESEKNEQDGLRLMLLGYFGGIRNLYMHIAPGHGMKTALP